MKTVGWWSQKVTVSVHINYTPTCVCTHAHRQTDRHTHTLETVTSIGTGCSTCTRFGTYTPSLFRSSSAKACTAFTRSFSACILAFSSGQKKPWLQNSCHSLTLLRQEKLKSTTKIWLGRNNQPNMKPLNRTKLIFLHIRKGTDKILRGWTQPPKSLSTV